MTLDVLPEDDAPPPQKRKEGTLSLYIKRAGAVFSICSVSVTIFDMCVEGAYIPAVGIAMVVVMWVVVGDLMKPILQRFAEKLKAWAEDR